MERGVSGGSPWNFNALVAAGPAPDQGVSDVIIVALIVGSDEYFGQA
jgi:hypothetical protein